MIFKINEYLKFQFIFDLERKKTLLNLIWCFSFLLSFGCTNMRLKIWPRVMWMQHIQKDSNIGIQKTKIVNPRRLSSANFYLVVERRLHNFLLFKVKTDLSHHDFYISMMSHNYIFMYFRRNFPISHLVFSFPIKITFHKAHTF